MITIKRIGNTYGGLTAKEESGKYYWIIGDYDTDFDILEEWEEISKTLYDELLKYNYMYTDNISGEKYTQQQIEANLKKTKTEIKQSQIDEYGWSFCVKCFELSQKGMRIPKDMEHTIIDMSHIKSIQDCKNDGEIERIWDVDNIEMLCRFHHLAHENKSKTR